MIRALLTPHALVQSTVEVSAGLADRERALLHGGGAHDGGSPADRAGLARRLNPLSAVRAARTGLALPFDGQLLAGAALVPAFLAGHRLGRSRGLAEAAQQAGEAALVGLIESVAAAATETGHVVVILASGTTFLAVGRAARAWTHGYAGTTGDHRTGAALELTRLALVGADRAGRALFPLLVVIGAHRARHCE